MGRSSGDACSSSPSPNDCTRSPQSTGGPRAGDTCGGSSGSPRCKNQMRQNLSDRPRGSDKADQPNVTTTAGTCQRKLLTHARQQFRPGNPRRVMVAGHFIKTSSRPAAAAPEPAEKATIRFNLRGQPGLLAKSPHRLTLSIGHLLESLNGFLGYVVPFGRFDRFVSHHLLQHEYGNLGVSRQPAPERTA